jgi:hypothetical protein
MRKTFWIKMVSSVSQPVMEYNEVKKCVNEKPPMIIHCSLGNRDDILPVKRGKSKNGQHLSRTDQKPSGGGHAAEKR